MTRSALNYNALAHILAERYVTFVAFTMFPNDILRARVNSAYDEAFGRDIDDLSVYSLYPIIRQQDLPRGLDQLVLHDEFVEQLRRSGDLNPEFAQLLGV